MKKITHYILAAAASIAFVACSVEPEIGTTGERVVFGASISYPNLAETRTVYSGELVEVGGRAVERIDWVAGSDEVAILNSTRGEAAVYTVGTPDASGEKSAASLTFASGDGMFWAPGTNTFLSVYPATALSDGTFGGNIPKVQPQTDSNALKTASTPPMSQLAYMVARKDTPRVDNVTLGYTPAMTAFEIELALAQAEGTRPPTISRLELFASGAANGEAALTGDWTWDGESFSCPDLEAGVNDTIRVDFPEGTPVSTGSPLRLTVFALPHDLTGLRLRLTLSSGVRTLSLKDKDSGEWTVFAGRKKYRITTPGVPGDAVTYTIDPLSDITLSHSGGSARLSATGAFRSLKTINGVTREAVPFKLQHSDDGGETWTDGLPEWIGAVSTSGFAGSVPGEELTATLDAQDNTASNPHTVALRAAEDVNDLDLSLVDPSTGTTLSPDNRTTANCYVVAAPGTYRFPLVYGNAVTGGADNDGAYHRQQTTNTSGGFLEYMRDHLGNDITQPYIAVQHPSAELSAELLWADAPGLVADVSLTGDGRDALVSFAVPRETIRQGNAVIAVKADGVIAWSWHIWVTDDDLSELIPGSNGFSLAPVNIGWCDGEYKEWYEPRGCLVRAVQTEDGGASSEPVYVSQDAWKLLYPIGNCTLYQWGRKDPMRPALEGGEDKPCFPEGGGRLPTASDSAATLEEAIRQPNVFFAGEGLTWYDIPPAEDRYYNIWNTGASQIQDFAEPVTKTVYDPSPVGFHVPSKAAYNGLTLSNFTWTERRGVNPAGRIHNVSGLYLPADGFRDPEMDGMAVKVEENGFYWSAALNTNPFTGTRSVSRLFFNKTSLGVSHDPISLARAFAVRPVKE